MHHTPPSERSIRLTRLVPNIITLLALCIGLSAIRFALKEQWESAVAFIMLAAILDGLDGRLARALHAESALGAQLDSLADFINFGVAPAILLYLWGMHEIRAVGWGVSLFFTVCCALRLARFTSSLDEEKETPRHNLFFFTGVPAPAGAILALLPLIMGFAFSMPHPEIYGALALWQNPLIVCISTTAVAILMASRLPTFSLKKLAVPRAYTSLILAAIGGVIIAFLLKPWAVLFCMGVLYVASIPVSAMLHAWLRQKPANPS